MREIVDNAIIYNYYLIERIEYKGLRKRESFKFD
jgi:hypothetical protein